MPDLKADKEAKAKATTDTITAKKADSKPTDRKPKDPKSNPPSDQPATRGSTDDPSPITTAPRRKPRKLVRQPAAPGDDASPRGTEAVAGEASSARATVGSSSVVGKKQARDGEPKTAVKTAYVESVPAAAAAVKAATGGNTQTPKTPRRRASKTQQGDAKLLIEESDKQPTKTAAEGSVERGLPTRPQRARKGTTTRNGGTSGDAGPLPTGIAETVHSEGAQVDDETIKADTTTQIGVVELVVPRGDGDGTATERAESAAGGSRSRPRRRPRKLAVKTKDAGEGHAAGSVEARVTVLEGRMEDMDLLVSQTAVDVGELRGEAPRTAGRRRGQRRGGGKVNGDVETDLVTDGGDAAASTAVIPLAYIDVDSDSEIEEIPRAEFPGTDGTQHTHRSTHRTASSATPLAVRGTYAVPLPAGVTTQDVRSIQQGARAAGSMLREINAAWRSSARVTSETRTTSGGKPTTTATTSRSASGGGTVSTTTGEQQTGSAFGGLIAQASKLVSDAMRTVEMQAVVEPESAGPARSGSGRGRKGAQSTAKSRANRR